MREYTDFYYNGTSSIQMGLINVSVSGGLFEESFLSSRKINSTQVRGNSKSYLTSVEREPLSFDLQFAFENPYDKQLISDVAKWLDQEYFRELYFTENPDIRYFCMLEGDSSLVHNGLGNGYIKLKMKCDSAYAYSQEYLTPELDYSVNVASGTDYTFLNNGHTFLHPEMWIKKIGDGDVTITNKATGDIFQFVGLSNNETVYVDNEREHIQSDIVGVYRFDNFNDNYLSLEDGRNILTIQGNCKIQFRYRFKRIQG